MLKLIVGIVGTIAGIIGLFNLLGGIVGLIWLLVLGKWSFVGICLVLFLASATMIGFAMMPSTIFLLPAARFAEKGNMPALLVMAFFSNIYVAVLMTIWCMAFFYFLTKDATASDLFPRLLVSYSLATGSWSYVASKNRGNQSYNETLSLLSMQTAYIVVMIMTYFFAAHFATVVTVFSVMMGVCFVLMVTLSYFLIREQAKEKLRQELVASIAEGVRTISEYEEEEDE